MIEVRNMLIGAAGLAALPALGYLIGLVWGLPGQSILTYSFVGLIGWTIILTVVSILMCEVERQRKPRAK